MHLFKKHLSTILISVFGVFLILHELRFEGTFGCFQPLGLFIPLLVITAMFVYDSVKWAEKEKRAKYNFTPLLIGLLLLIMAGVANRTTYHKLNAKDNYILYKKLPSRRQLIILNLKSNSNYVAETKDVEWFNRYAGKYKICNDTLYLDKPIISSNSDTLIQSVYIFNKEKDYLLPLCNDNRMPDSSQFLKVDFAQFTH